jgi:hypothetical protein
MKTKIVHLLYGMVMLLTILSSSSCEKSAEERDLAIGEEGLSGSITRFAVLGDYLYALNPNGVLTYNVSNASKPVLTSIINTDYGLETITIYDGYVYIGSRTSLYILDISNPSIPTILSQTQGGSLLGGGCDPVVVKGDYYYKNDRKYMRKYICK